jgi:hypothetical protein
MGLFLQLSFPEIIFRPPVWQRADRPRLPDLDRRGKAIEEDAPLQGLLSNIPECMPERVLDEQRSRWLDLLGDLLDQS